jgi:hypothetical protein
MPCGLLKVHTRIRGTSSTKVEHFIVTALRTLNLPKFASLPKFNLTYRPSNCLCVLNSHFTRRNAANITCVHALVSYKFLHLVVNSYLFLQLTFVYVMDTIKRDCSNHSVSKCDTSLLLVPSRTRKKSV